MTEDLATSSRQESLLCTTSLLSRGWTQLKALAAISLMAANPAHAEHVQQSVMTVSETVSSIVESLTELPGTMNITIPSAMVVPNATTMELAHSQRSWLGMFGQLIIFLVKLVPGILYWLITFTTITLPTFLFTLFSTSLTVTMNATTV